MNNWFTYLSFTLSVLSVTTSFATDKECWNESRECTFNGSLELHTFPSGRTNRDGIDELETNLYLKLTPPVRVHFKDWDNKDAPATELVTLMEIAGEFDGRLFKIAKNKKKNHVTVTAKIFGQETGHHHTKFLIDANNNIIVDNGARGGT